MTVLNSTPTDHEREIAADVASKAMVAGWDKAIKDVAAARGFPALAIEGILNKVSKENDTRDPSARIDELGDWEVQKQRNSQLKPNSLHKLSPGLRAYMERKLNRS